MKRLHSDMEDKMSLKIGIIGCGGIANGKHLPALSKLAIVELVAFCDLEVSRAEAAKKAFGTEDALVFTDYQDLLKLDLDAVHVLTPNSSHAPLTIAALEAGCHVMCEKPMAKTSKEAKAMIEAAKRTGKKLTIGYQNRFRTDSQYLHTICESGELGEVYTAKAHAIRRRAVPTWGVFLDEAAQGGGPLIDIGTHALDLTLWMMNNYTPKYVVGNAYHKLSGTKNAANAWGPWDPEKFTVEDSAIGFVVMENGATIYLESSWANGEAHGLLYEKKIELETGGVDFYDGAGDDPAFNEAESWYDAIVNDTDPLVKPEQALVVTQILEGIYESAETGQPVFL